MIHVERSSWIKFRSASDIIRIWYVYLIDQYFGTLTLECKIHSTYTFVCAPFVLSSQGFYLLHISPLLARISRQEYVDARIHPSEMDMEFTFKVVTNSSNTDLPYAPPRNKFHDFILFFRSFVRT